MPLLNAIVDLSHHNTVPDFHVVKDSGILGVIHKATEGTGYVDPKYNSRRSQALDVGLFWGAYHFGTSGNVSDQVNHFLEIVNPVPADLLVLDFEPDPHTGTMTLAEAEMFVEQIHARTERYPGLYSGQAFINEQLGQNTGTILKNCFLWIARYSSRLPQVPAAFKTFTLWQYTDGNIGPEPHQVPGIGRCDRDKFNGDVEGLKKLWGHAEPEASTGSGSGRP